MPTKNSLFCTLLLALISFTLSASPLRAQDTPLHVVVSFSILADMTKMIGGKDVDVISLVGPDADTHTYQPTTSDAEKITHADLVIINGLGFEGWITKLIEASGYKGKIIIASVGVHELPNDPHAWQDLSNGRIYINNIAQALAERLPSKAYAIKQNAQNYDAELVKLDTRIKSDIRTIPASKRIIITSHDAFEYFGSAYGITFLAPEGISPDAEPSAKDIALLINQIKDRGVKTLFLENMTSPKLIQQIAHDTEAQLGATLCADALSAPDGVAPTYLSMFENNLIQFMAAMRLNR
jgi:zinc/manganese transport system substrate-binding protein